MKRIVMAKYGFERWPEKDFTDDSSRYVCYRAGKAIRVSKLIADGQAYLSISSDVGRGTLPYEVYSKLPHYHDHLVAAGTIFYPLNRKFATSPI